MLVCVILSVLAETFIFNLKSLTLENNNTFEIPYTTKKVDDKIELNLSLEPQYIRQLLIEYTSTEDVNYSIQYTHKGAYDHDTDETFTDTFDNSFTLSATNINADVSKLLITYNKKDSHEIQINKIFIDNAFHFNYFRTCFIFLSLLAFFFLFFFYKDGFQTDKIHLYFATICSILGLMIIVAQPATSFFSWDDQIHFDRIVNFPIGVVEYSIGEFNMSDAGTFNRNWPDLTDSFTENRLHSKLLDSESNSGYTGNNASSFLFIHKIPYIPMAIGYYFAKLIGLPFTACFLIGKSFNLIFYILLMTYAIKKLRTGKRLLTVIALLPTNIFLASSYSYDPAVITGITIFVVHIINLLLDKDNHHTFDFKTATILIASMTYACLAKATYAPIMLLALLIPKTKFKNPKQSRYIKIGFSLITILLGSTLLLSAFDGANVSDTRGGEVSVKDQASLIMSHPLDYASVLSDTAVSEFGHKLFSANTLTNFSYTHAFTDHNNFYYIFFILLIFAFFTDNRDNHLTKKQRSWIVCINLLVIILIWTALYVDFTPVGLTTINGVQNRYFLPLLFSTLFSLQFPNIQNKINPKYYNLAIFTFTVIAMIFMVYQFILLPYNS